MAVSILIGVVLAVGSLIASFIMEGGSLHSLISTTSLILIFGGTMGAVFVSFPLSDIISVPKALAKLIGKNNNEVNMISYIVELANKVRKEGLLSLEKELNNMDSFLRKGIQLVIDGGDPEFIRSVMETELYSIRETINIGHKIFEAAGGYAPTMGIIGTVMGLVHVLGNLKNPEMLGPSIAMAFLATLYGVGSANIIWLPMAEKLKTVSKQEQLLYEIVIEGILLIQNGINPTLIQERLVAFLQPNQKEIVGGSINAV